MIMIQGEVSGKIYTEPFSKGVLSRSLIMAEMDPNKAYEFASAIESNLREEEVNLIAIEELVEIIIEDLVNEDSVVAKKYIAWRKIKQAHEPLVILIGGASGVGTSSIAFEIANRLGIRNMISTDMIREVMRKIVSKELSPVIHESSFTAYKGMRVPPPPEFDDVLAGFRDHVDTVSVGIEAVIERSITEGISIVIEGVHLVPGFIKEELMEKHNVVMFVLTLQDKEIHKGRFYSRCRQMWARRPLQIYLDNFFAIRKIHNYFESQAKNFNIPAIENIDVLTTIDSVIKCITENYGGIPDAKEDESK